MKTLMNYKYGQNELENWIVAEDGFDPTLQGKGEVVMALGNGYMGMRSSTEEIYVGQIRNLFVSGTFNQFDEYEVTELPNAADIVELNILINGERFNLEQGKTISYNRRLNLKNGELIRELVWENDKGEQFEMTFRRFISSANLHLVGMQVSIKALTAPATISIKSGINAQMTNSGSQHFHEGEKRIFDKKYVQLIQTTTESKIDFVFNTTHNWYLNGEATEVEPFMEIDRRRVSIRGTVELAVNEEVTMEKFTNIHTSRDKKWENEYDLQTMRDFALEDLKAINEKRFDALLAESAAVWAKRWEEIDITIESETNYEQLAIRFAQYHLFIMTPAHDNRFGIGAKGLTGEGYKGHSFWDTEIFILPFYTFTEPKIARSLLEYRYNTIGGARKKAIDNGYKGAMYPWESAFTGDEVTPVWGAVDIVTGEATKIWSGFIEQHITCDIAFAAWQYYMVTGDQDFMDKYGYEMLLDTATFWASRVVWNEEKEQYEILEVIGPDEYKEHVDNNAFTNYMAQWNIAIAIKYYNDLKENRPELFARLNEQMDLDGRLVEWKEVVDKIYLPQPREEDNVIAQDDTYLTKEIIDLTKYKNQTHIGSMFHDYNLEQVNNIQVSKQADIMVLFYLLEDKFSQEVKRANWNYYEPKTLHDSSLSLSTHCVLANDMNDEEMAYDLFQKAARIDLGENMKTSDHGIHAASQGGVWQSVVFGFGGVRMLNGKLRINPSLPKAWNHLHFAFEWQGDRLEVDVTREGVKVENVTRKNATLEIEINGEQHQLVDTIQL
ncbi:MAG: glycoside hydrolase family 65 protein [Bacillaceae bacterium]